jgi:Leucine-rich repeat (LRR) protein
MMIAVRENTEYDTDIHPEVTEIHFKRHIVGNFFKDDRFPNLVILYCVNNQLTELKVNCSSLRTLWCDHNQLTTLDLICPSLQTLWCHNNLLTTLELICPSLQMLFCYNNKLTTLKLNCPSLQTLWCSINQLTKLELNYPSLQSLYCKNNQLTNLNGLEFCENLNYLQCSESLSESVNILKAHLPNLEVEYC